MWITTPTPWWDEGWGERLYQERHTEYQTLAVGASGCQDWQPTGPLRNQRVTWGDRSKKSPPPLLSPLEPHPPLQSGCLISVSTPRTQPAWHFSDSSGTSVQALHPLTLFLKFNLFSKEDIQMTNKHMKKKKKKTQHCLLLEKGKSKPQWSSHLIPVRTTIVKKNPTNNKCWRGCGEKGTLLSCWWECKWIQPLWSLVRRFLKVQSLIAPRSLQTTLQSCPSLPSPTLLVYHPCSKH